MKTQLKVIALSVLVATSLEKLVYCPSIDQLLFKRVPINAFQLFFL
jgi:hypothetical protein